MLTFPTPSSFEHPKSQFYFLTQKSGEILSKDFTMKIIRSLLINDHPLAEFLLSYFTKFLKVFSEKPKMNIIISCVMVMHWLYEAATNLK